MWEVYIIVCYLSCIHGTRVILIKDRMPPKVREAILICVAHRNKQNNYDKFAIAYDYRAVDFSMESCENSIYKISIKKENNFWFVIFFKLIGSLLIGIESKN